MNIFAALSQGKGKLNEENMSAMLGFLLNPLQTHDIGDVFLHRFLKAVALSIDDINRFEPFRNQYTYDIDYEKPYYLAEKKRYIDIEVRLYNRDVSNRNDTKEMHRIVIENKIRAHSAQDQQLKEQYEGIREDIGEDPVKITMVFLTPPGEHLKLQSEYGSLNMHGNHQKTWMRWHGKEETTIASLIREVLCDEASIRINPLSEYLKHTLKAFVYHIETEVTPTSQRLPLELGLIKDQKSITLSDDKTYQIEFYQNGSIKVYNVNDEIFEPALTILKRVIQEKQINIDTHNANGQPKNTRQLGKQLLESL